MSTINVIRYANGRTIYNCENSPYAPTNPKLGDSTQSNTIVWNPNNRITTMTQPRERDEYVTRSKAVSLGGTYPTTNRQSPYFTSVKKTEGTDSYGRSAVTLTERSKSQTVVSRYSTDSLSIKCTPKITADCFSGK